jgi:hypothetical protein
MGPDAADALARMGKTLSAKQLSFQSRTFVRTRDRTANCFTSPTLQRPFTIAPIDYRSA